MTLSFLLQYSWVGIPPNWLQYSVLHTFFSYICWDTNQVLEFALLLGEGEGAQLPGQLECGQDRVAAGESDEGGAGERAILVDTTQRVTQRVLFWLTNTALTAASAGQGENIAKKTSQETCANYKHVFEVGTITVCWKIIRE